MQERIEKLIQEIRRKGYLNDQKIEEVLRKTPRHLFVPENLLDEAYDDRPLETKNYQTISQPSVVSIMTKLLDVNTGMNILEIGTGSGWQSAILSKMVFPAKVYSIERHAELVKFAKSNHQKAGINNVEVMFGDGTKGFPEKAPYDRIIITAACKKIPEELVEQLREGGLLVAPVGNDIQTMIVFQKLGNQIIKKSKESGYVFVPLISDSI